MLRSCYVTAALAVLLLPHAPRFSEAAIAQEVEGCYMLSNTGKTLDLSQLCGGMKQSGGTSAQSSLSTVLPTTGRVFQAKIKRREGGTPVIDVTFNNQQTFEMIVDTGASSTVITQQMARAMAVVPVAKLKFDTASAKGVEMPLGSLQSVEAGGAVAKGLLVAIAGPTLGTGLLGHDFFGQYDITIKQDVVEFHVR
jgi:predicted aspartyl protease